MSKKNIISHILNSSTLERVTVVVSFLYCVGVVILILFNSIYVGDFDFDFVRVKPIVVGIQYMLYLSLPLLVVYVPVILTGCQDFGWLWQRIPGCSKSLCRVILVSVCRICFCLSCSVFLFFVIGEMFHYFIPYTEYMYYSRNFVYSLWQIACAFWQLYLCWDINIIAFGCLFVAGGLFLLHMSGIIRLRSKVSRVRFIWTIVMLILVGFFTNMYYFTRDVYLNISQGAAGGAPVCGIITIVSPGEQARKGLDGRVCECDEITKYCTIMQANSEYLYIDDHVVGDRGQHGDSHVMTTLCATRIRRDSVKQFTPLKHPMKYQDDKYRMFAGEVFNELVYNVDLYVDIALMAKSEEQTESLPHVFNVTNRIEAIWHGDNSPRCVLLSTGQRVVKKGATNLCYTVEFHNFPVPNGTQASKFFDAFSAEDAYLELLVKNLPPLPAGVQSTSITVGVVVNYFFPMNWFVKRELGYGREISIKHKFSRADVEREVFKRNASSGEADSGGKIKVPK